MTVLRINKKEKNFLILDKTCLQDQALSWGAKGLHAYLMSLPDNWQVKVSDLSNRATNGRDSVRGLLNELKTKGYIVTSWLRNEKTGKFNSLEYLVHETPQHIFSDSDVPCPEYPATDNPSPAEPCTEKTTLISINTNKDPFKKVLTAAAQGDAVQTENINPQYQKAAAVSFSQNQNKENASKPQGQGAYVKLAGSDLVIGDALTLHQQRFVQTLIHRLTQKMHDLDAEKLEQEVTYCLLNPHHFTACGRDFNRKLNAIRMVIARGEWQTPAGMIVEQQQEALVQEQEYIDQIDCLKSQIMNAEIEYRHFQRFLGISQGAGREALEATLIQTKNKIESLKAELALTQHQQQPEDFLAVH